MNVVMTRRASLQLLTTLLLNREEVGWFGKVEKINDETLVIKEIRLYPQIVTAAHIDLGDDYMKWNAEQDDDFMEHRRFHGHSHVYMHPSPSGTDLRDQEGITSLLEEDDYYIFMIINKNLDYYCWYCEKDKKESIELLWPNEIIDMIEQQKLVVPAAMKNIYTFDRFEGNYYEFE